MLKMGRIEKCTTREYNSVLEYLTGMHKVLSSILDTGNKMQQGLKTWFLVKNTDCSSRRPRFHSQHTHMAVHNYLTPVYGLWGSDALY